MNDLQRKMMGEQNLAQNIAAKAHEAMVTLMRVTPFPVERLSEEWRLIAKLAIKKSSAFNHRIDLNVFADVAGIDPITEPINYFAFGVFCNSIEQVPFEELGFTVGKTYRRFIKNEVWPHVLFCNEQTEKWKKEAKERLIMAQQEKLVDKSTPNNLKAEA